MRGERGGIRLPVSGLHGCLETALLLAVPDALVRQHREDILPGGAPAGAHHAATGVDPALEVVLVTLHGLDIGSGGGYLRCQRLQVRGR